MIKYLPWLLAVLVPVIAVAFLPWRGDLLHQVTMILIALAAAYVAFQLTRMWLDR